MARPLRLELAGALYDVTARGNERKSVFLQDGEGDRTAFLQILGATCDRFNWICHAYCLMTNHYHVVLGHRESGPFFEDWSWSSYVAHLGQAPVPAWRDPPGLRGYLLGRPARSAADRRRAARSLRPAGGLDARCQSVGQRAAPADLSGRRGFVERMQALADPRNSTDHDIPGLSGASRARWPNDWQAARIGKRRYTEPTRKARSA